MAPELCESMGFGGTRQRSLLTGFEERLRTTTAQSLTETSAQGWTCKSFLMPAIKPLANVRLAFSIIIKSTTNKLQRLYNTRQVQFKLYFPLPI